MEDKIQDIIEKVEDSLNGYRQSLIGIDSNSKSMFDFTINYKNERSIASYITYQLADIFESIGMKNVYVINEMDLRIKYELADEKILELEKNVDKITISKKKIKFIPDTFVTFSNSENNLVHIFIEYKINNIFKYIQLASDYMKFKQYTINTQTNPYFAYLLLNPSNNGMDITLKKDHLSNIKYQIMEKNIDESTLDDDATVFIHKYQSTQNGITQDVLPIIENIEENIKDFEFLSHKEEFHNIKDFSTNPYFSNAGKFGSRVLNSHRIQKKYLEIKQLYDILRNYKEDIAVPQDAFITLDSFKSSIEDDINFIDKLTSYFNNQIKQQTRSSEGLIDPATFSYNRKRALWIQMLLQKFSNDLGLGLDLIYFYDKKEEEASKGILKMLENSYKGKDLHNFNQLVMGLVHYIVVFYDSIYIFNETRLEQKDEYKAYEIKSTILNNLKQLKRKLGFRGATIDWNSDILYEGSRILLKLLKDS